MSREVKACVVSASEEYLLLAVPPGSVDGLVFEDALTVVIPEGPRKPEGSK